MKRQSRPLEAEDKLKNNSHCDASQKKKDKGGPDVLVVGSCTHSRCRLCRLSDPIQVAPVGLRSHLGRANDGCDLPLQEFF